MIMDGIVDEHEAAKKQDDMMIDYGKITFHTSRIVPHRYGIIDDRFHNLKELQYDVHSLNSIYQIQRCQNVQIFEFVCMACY